jgi:hypothetical protein
MTLRRCLRVTVRENARMAAEIVRGCPRIDERSRQSVHQKGFSEESIPTHSGNAAGSLLHNQNYRTKCHVTLIESGIHGKLIRTDLRDSAARVKEHPALPWLSGFSNCVSLPRC